MFKCDANSVSILCRRTAPRERGNSIRERELNVPLLALRDISHRRAISVANKA
jgi:hypothetical protein